MQGVWQQQHKTKQPVLDDLLAIRASSSTCTTRATASIAFYSIEPYTDAAPEWLMRAVSRGTTAGCASSATRMSSTRRPWRQQRMYSVLVLEHRRIRIRVKGSTNITMSIREHGSVHGTKMSKRISQSARSLVVKRLPGSNPPSAAGAGSPRTSAAGPGPRRPAEPAPPAAAALHMKGRHFRRAICSSARQTLQHSLPTY